MNDEIKLPFENSDPRALLAALLKAGATEKLTPLSLQQRRFWVLRRMRTDVPTHVTLACEIEGDLDVDRFQRAVGAVLGHHTLLRTAFVEIDGQAHRVRGESPWVTVSVMDLRGVSGDRREQEVLRVVSRDAQQPFEVESAPLLRMTMLRLAQDRSLLVLTAHQLVSDSDGLWLLMRELLRAYAGRPPLQSQEQPSDGEQERAFLSWQNERGQGPHAQDALAYVREALAELPVLELPTDHRRPAQMVQALRAGRVRSELSVQQTAKLRALATQLKTGPFELLLAAYQLVLSRHAGQSDFAVGTTVSYRSFGAWSDLVAPLQNMVAIPAHLVQEESFAALVARVDAATQRARKRAWFPFEQQLEALREPAAAGRSPLFQVTFTLEQAQQPLSEAGLTLTPLDLHTGICPFELALRAVETHDRIALSLDYNLALFEQERAQRMLAHLNIFLQNVLADPPRTAHQVRLCNLSMLPQHEHRKLVVEWNDTQRAYASASCLHELVEQQVQLSPDAVALVAPDGSYRYRELNQRANQLARELIERGVTQGAHVGVMAERSAGAVISLLAVLKAGAAYVPIDPASPPARLRFMLRDADIHLVIVSKNTVLALQDYPIHFVRNDDEDLLRRHHHHDLPNQVSPEHLANIIYTSGSTGQPKGVLVPHRALVNSTQARLAVFPFPNRYLMLAPLFFDASAAGLYGCLSTGGTLILPSDEQVEHARLLSRLIKTEHVTHIDAVPSQYALLADRGNRSLDGLRCCVLAGEALPPALINEHREVAPEAQLFNEYGPTECTVWSTVFPCEAFVEGDSVPIGRPIANARAYVLDDAMNPVPIGVVGELYIGGDGVTTGYHARPRLTAARYLPDPFSQRAGARLYRTGDRVRWLPDGQLDFAGRSDDQVKLAGVRIELGDVESAIRQHPRVRAAAVRLQSEAGETPKLVAYVVPEGGSAPDRAELVEFLRDRLPAYMAPSAVVALDRLPLSRTGKLDTRALDRVEATTGGQDPASADAPSGSTLHEEVRSVFVSVLGVERVGLDDDFFDLGGNSLLVSKVGARLCRAYNIDLPLHEFFTLPTVRGVARTIEIYKRKGHDGLLAARDPASVAAEAILDESISADGLPLAAHLDPSEILLTGVTGYLGVYLLQELMRQTRALVWVLIRAEDETHALRRLQATREKFAVEWQPEWDARVRVLVGDLAKPLLGLDSAKFAQLAQSLDLILHNGALVNFVLPYSVMKAPNVLGTHEVLRLACHTRLKAVHYVSTIDVLIGSHEPRPFLEQELAAQPRRAPFSYPQSKWIAEKMIEKARARGVPATVYRPSIMMGHTQTGAVHETDYIVVALKGFLEMGVLPEYKEILNSTSIDYASKAIVHIMGQESSIDKVFHLWNTDAIPTMRTYDWVRSYGYDFELVSFEEAFRRANDLKPNHPLYPLLPVLHLYAAGDSGARMDWEIQQVVDARLECSNTVTELERVGVECPPIDERHIHSMLDFLIARGELKSPAEMRAEAAE